MSDSVERVASALLYEGYLLYPYRRSAVKNRQRFNFGVVYPEAYSRAQQGMDACTMQTECLVQGDSGTRLDASVRFLHLFEHPTERPDEPAWHEAIERCVRIGGVPLGELPAGVEPRTFVCPAGDAPGRQVSLRGEVELAAESVAAGVYRIRVRIANRTKFEAGDSPDRDEALLRALVSAHTILRVEAGEFISLTDPPEALRHPAAECRNIGTWPVLAGDDRARDTLLSSPVIVSDFPGIAPESPGDFFDATEMDEMLSLRILTLTDEEKREMAASDERARRLLARTEALDEEQFLRMHGALRDIRRLGEGP